MSSTNFNNRKSDSSGFESMDELQVVDIKCENEDELKVKTHAVISELKFKMKVVKQETAVVETRKPYDPKKNLKSTQERPIQQFSSMKPIEIDIEEYDEEFKVPPSNTDSWASFSSAYSSFQEIVEPAKVATSHNEKPFNYMEKLLEMRPKPFVYEGNDLDEPIYTNEFRDSIQGKMDLPEFTYKDNSKCEQTHNEDHYSKEQITSIIEENLTMKRILRERKIDISSIDLNTEYAINEEGTTISTYKPAIQPKPKLFHAPATLSHPTHSEPIYHSISVAERIPPQVPPKPSYNKGENVRSNSLGFGETMKNMLSSAGGTVKSKFYVNINSDSKTEEVVLRSTTARSLNRSIGTHFHNYRDSNESTESTAPESAPPEDDVRLQEEETTEEKLARIIEEIVDFENNFNQTVGKGLKNYLHVSHSESSAYLELIRNNQFKIFGNIEEIHRFHKDIFYPKLLQCAGDIHKIFDMFLNFIKDGHFYCYVTYAMNSMNFQKIWAENRDTINERQHEVKDSLGLHALLAEPIQHLTRYTLFFVKITDKFPKKLDDIDDSIKRSFLAERQIKNYVQMVNNSMKIHDIKQCYEIDIFKQGKFVRVDAFDIVCNTEPTYNGKIFLFENSIILTEIIRRNKLHELKYREHFACSCTKLKRLDDRRIIISKINRVVKLEADERTIFYWTKSLDAILENICDIEKINTMKYALDKVRDDMLVKEDMYISKLKHNYKYYFQNEHEGLTELQHFLNKIIEFHSNVLYFNLQRSDKNFKALANVFRNSFDLDIKNYYYKYSAFLPLALKYFQMNRESNKDTTELLSIEEFLNLPVQQLAFYENAFTTTLDNYERIDQEPAEDNDYLATLATVEVKMKEMHKKAEEIVKIYEIFDDNIFYVNTGLIHYYDEGVCNKVKSKIFLMDKQLIAVSAKDEHPYNILFQASYKYADIKDALLISECVIKFELRVMKKKQYSFHFRAPFKKQAFLHKFQEKKREITGL